MCITKSGTNIILKFIICIHLMKKICLLIKNCLYKCFRDEEDQYRDRVIELQERMFRRQKSDKQQNIYIDQRTSQPEFMSNHQTPKKQCPQTQNESQQVNEQKIQQKNRISNGSADSYFTINSGSTVKHGISRRKFKRSNSSKRNLFASTQLQHMTKNSEFKQIRPQQTYYPQLNMSRVESQYNGLSNALYQWNEMQYQRISTNVNFQLSSTQQLKLQSNTFVNQAINKLQDFYTFYFNQINSQFMRSGKQQQQYFSSHNGYIFRKFPQFKCCYNSQFDNVNASETYMVLMTFQTNTSNVIEFLKWYNSIMVQSKIFNFQKIKLVDNSQYPIFQVQQYGHDLKEKYTYLAFRQIQNIRFDDQPDTQYCIELNSTFRKGKNFKNIIRFSQSQNGIVQIFYESEKKINIKPQDYYFKKFQSLYKLNRERLIDISNSRLTN